MNHKKPDPAFQELVERALNHELTPADVSALNERLPRDADARAYFLEMQALSDGLYQELVGQKGLVPLPVRGEAMPKTRRRLAPLVGALAAILVVTGFLLWFFTRPPELAFTISAAMQQTDEFVTGSSIHVGDELRLTQGQIDLRSPSGLELSLTAPVVLEVEGTDRLRLKQGTLLTHTHGRSLAIATSTGLIENVGTTYGVRNSSTGETRVDVFEGEINFQRDGDSGAAFNAGQSGTAGQSQWPPKLGKADPAIYPQPLDTPLGVNFSSEPGQALRRELPSDPLWVSARGQQGRQRLAGEGLQLTWAATSVHDRGPTTPPELQVFRCHLRGYPLNPENQPKAGKWRVDPSRHGAVIHLSGLKKWLRARGADSYQITVLRASNLTEVGFSPLVVCPSGVFTAELEQQLPAPEAEAVELPDGPGSGPAPDDALVVRQRLPLMRHDQLLITTPPQLRDETSPRANICGLLIKPVYAEK